MLFRSTGSAIGLSAALFADNSLVVMAVYAVVFGFFIGATPLIGPMTWSTYYGRAFTGTIQGSVAPLQMLSSSLAPLFAAWVVDLNKSDLSHGYNLAALTYMGAYVLAAGLMFLAPKPVYRGAGVPAAR